MQILNEKAVNGKILAAFLFIYVAQCKMFRDKKEFYLKLK